MDRGTAALCLDIYDRALEGPLGSSVRNIFESEYKIPEDCPSLSKVRSRLLDLSYESVAEYIDDLNKTVDYIMRALSPESDITLALETIRQMIVSESKGLLCGDDQQWKSGLTNFISELTEYAEKVPNNRDQFREFTKTLLKRDRADDKGTTKQPPHVEIHNLKSLIQRLAKDEDEYELVAIIRRYEPEYANIDSVTDIDLKKLNPITLAKLHAFASSHAPPPPPKNDIKRTASSPIARNQKTTVAFKGPMTNAIPDTSPFLAKLVGAPMQHTATLGVPVVGPNGTHVTINGEQVACKITPVIRAAMGASGLKLTQVVAGPQAIPVKLPVKQETEKKPE